MASLGSSIVYGILRVTKELKIGGFVATHFGNFVTMLKSLTSVTLSGKISGSGTFDENGVLSISTTSNITKTDVGLGAVLNYGLATTTEAQAGTSNLKYMTPLRVKEAIHTLAVGSASPGEILAFEHPEGIDFFDSSSYYKKRAWMQVGIDGTYRVSFDMRATKTSDTLYGRIYVNGIARGTVRQTTSTSFTTYTEDITIDHGDTVELWFKNTSTFQCYWGNFELKVNYPFPTIIDYDFDRSGG